MSQPSSCFKADPQMVTVIAKLQSKPGSAPSLCRPGCPPGDVEGFRLSESEVNASSADRTGVPLSRSHPQIQDICTNCSCPPVLEIFQDEKEIHLPTIPRACLPPVLQSIKVKSLCRSSAHTLSLKSLQPDVTQPVPLPSPSQPP